jgi:hypothetical protein
MVVVVVVEARYQPARNGELIKEINQLLGRRIPNSYLNDTKKPYKGE